MAKTRAAALVLVAEVVAIAAAAPPLRGGFECASALQAAHKRGVVLRTLRLSHIVVSPDGQRLKLGPSALANFALTDGSASDGGGKILSAADLPPVSGPLATELSARGGTAGTASAPADQRPAITQHAGDELAGTDFAGMDGVVFRKALGLLAQQGKATIYPSASSADEDGIKFTAIG